MKTKINNASDHTTIAECCLIFPFLSLNQFIYCIPRPYAPCIITSFAVIKFTFMSFPREMFVPCLGCATHLFANFHSDSLCVISESEFPVNVLWEFRAKSPLQTIDPGVIRCVSENPIWRISRVCLMISTARNLIQLSSSPCLIVYYDTFQKIQILSIYPFA